MRLIINSIGFLFLIICCHSCNIERVSALNEERVDLVWPEKAINDSLITQHYLFGDKYKEVKKSIGIYGKTNEECIYYYRNGNAKCYQFYNDGELKYYRNYDSNGVTESYKGGGVLYVDSISCDTILTNVKYGIDVHFVNPPNTEIKVFIGDRVENEKKRDMKKYPLYPYVITNSTTSYQIANINEGIREVIIYWAIEDIVSKDIQKGKILHHYTIVPSSP